MRFLLATAGAMVRWRVSPAGRLLVRLVCDQRGQDLAEYALLTAFIGLAGLATWSVIDATFFSAYQSYDQGTQAIWECEPGTCAGS